MIFYIYYHSRFNPPFLEDFPTTFTLHIAAARPYPWSRIRSTSQAPKRWKDDGKMWRMGFKWKSHHDWTTGESIVNIVNIFLFWGKPLRKSKYILVILIDTAWYGINPKFFFFCKMFHRFLGFLDIIPMTYWCVLRRVAGWVGNGGCWDDDISDELWIIPSNSLRKTHAPVRWYPLVNIHNYGKSPFFYG